MAVACVHTPAGHPRSKATRVMIPTKIRFSHLALAIVGASKFASPNNERVFQKTARFQVLDQCHRSLVGLFRVVSHIAGTISVGVPSRMENLDKRHPAFRESSSHKAIGRVGTRLGYAFAIEIQRCFGLAANIGHLRHRSLHAKRHFVLLNLAF